MNRKSMRKKLIVPGLVFGAVALAAAPAMAVDVYIVAKQVLKPMPDGEMVPMWAFGVDPDGPDADTLGDCFWSASNTSRLACINALPDSVFTVPGPRLELPAAAAGENLRVYLSNGLPVPTSVVIPGQEMPYSGATSGPTWDDGSTGARPSADARVRSFGLEAVANGGRRTYFWNVAQNTAFQPGTYSYHSGTHPQVQVQMGLYGAATRDVAAGEAYGGVPYDAEVDLFFSEIDPDLHAAVAAGTHTGSTLNYKPKYFLINGEPFDPDNSTCIDDDFAIDDRILLRLHNQGLRELAPMMLGSHVDLIAEGGKAYPFARRQYQTLLMPGSTQDALFVPDREDTFPIFVRRLNLTTPSSTYPAAPLTDPGGFRTCLAVGAGGPVASENFYFSTVGGGSGGAIAGVASPYDDADIYQWNGTSFSRLFDASANGLPGNADIDGLKIVGGTFYVSFTGATSAQTTTVPGLGAVEDEDVVTYDGSDWGPFFDGTACGLDASNGQDIDAIDVVAGTLYFSTLGGGNGNSVAGVPSPYDDADIYTWQVGSTTCGRLFDASANGLPGNADIDALTIVDNDTFYLSFRGATSAQTTTVPGLGAVEDEDVVLYDNGTWSLFFGGTAQGLTANGQDIDAIQVVP